MKALGLNIIPLTICLSLLSAQYSEEWSIEQDGYEYGMVYLDLNHDGVDEIVKHLYNSFTVYDGAQNYSAVWSIIDDNYEYLSLYDMFDMQNNGTDVAVVVAYNLYANYDTQISGFTPFATDANWSSPVYDGVVYRLDAADLDDDGVKEIAVGINTFDSNDSTYTSSLYILNGLTGEQEWSKNMNGYMIGPYLGNQDSDATIEIVYNLYQVGSGTYTLNVYSYTGTQATGDQNISPNTVNLGENFPNPFNGNTTIPVVLSHETRLSLAIIDINGKTINTITNGNFSPGRYQFHWDGNTINSTSAASGMYFYQVKMPGQIITKPLLYLK